MNGTRLSTMIMPGGYIPKAYWGPGPWQREPDICDWRYAGFHCGAWRSMVTGGWSGYVGVSGDHPLFGKHYRECVLACDPPREARNPDSPRARIVEHFDIPDYNCGHTPSDLIDVHGGVNFAGPRPWDVGLWWFGFDCSHGWDFMPAMEATLEIIMPPEHMAWKRELRRQGGRLGMLEQYRTLHYVRRAVNELAVQLRLRPTHRHRNPWPWPTLVAAVVGAR